MRNQPSTCLNYIHLLDSESTQVSLCYPVLNKKSFHGTCSDLPSCSKSLPTCIQRRYMYRYLTDHEQSMEIKVARLV